ncbi:RNA-binding S4 domain-containing protein [Brachybacterium halotolerans subsp. kimchii]|uniref:RNA-binding S4 domain-containing protein n=1 Tax=Brachybacterium halotolerans TaxID=2795215 RepID=UPI001E5518F7|nr:RNA-binding S4 domain-containing protein [Brachybacterium halotolerans]UEJ83515.1 RNA-binding S4 domain-containing protein [Brachybacterium halotolerans subsp. kimchii]
MSGGQGPHGASGPTGPTGPTAVRADVWLWSARLFPTRSAATAACRGGHVRRDGDLVKASQRISVGDELRVRRPGRERIVVVTRLLEKRVGAPVAREAYEDHSPEPAPQLLAAPPRRDRGAGRPTKKDRREMDRLRGRGMAPAEALGETPDDLRPGREARGG